MVSETQKSRKAEFKRDTNDNFYSTNVKRGAKRPGFAIHSLALMSIEPMRFNICSINFDKAVEAAYTFRIFLESEDLFDPIACKEITRAALIFIVSNRLIQ